MSNHFHHPNELSPPPNADGDPNAGEVVRAWSIKGGLEVSLNPLAFQNMGIWGLLLVDVARHVARACEQEGKGSFDENFELIRQTIEAEFDMPTDLGTTNKVRSN
jgi:hypothetical protein